MKRTDWIAILFIGFKWAGIGWPAEASWWWLLLLPVLIAINVAAKAGEK